MEKTFNINAGNAILLNDRAEVFAGYDSVKINAGHVLASRKVYEKLIGMNVFINSGNVKIIDIEGEIVELAANTVITAAMSYDGCFLVCDGNLVIEDAKGLKDITGIYAKTIFHAESIDISNIKGINSSSRVVYPDEAKLRFGEITLGEDTHLTLEDNALYWVHGRMKALDSGAVEKMRQKKTSFHCKQLIIHTGLHEKYGDMFKADNYIFVPDGHAVVGDITLDAATSLLYGDQIFVLGNLTIPHDQTSHLQGFSSLIVNGTVIMPVSAAADFKAGGKANHYDLYEGVLMDVNGFQTLGHEQLQTAIEKGISYTLRINGTLYMFSDVTAQDIDAIAAVDCNGLISAPGGARGALDSKVRRMNGTILDIDAMMKKLYGDDFSFGEDPIGTIMKMIGKMNGNENGGSSVNVATYKL